LAFLQHSRLHPFLDQAKYSSVSHSVLDELDCPFVTHSVEEVPNVRVEYPVHPLRLDSHRQRIQRLMRAASGSEPIRKAFEVHLVNLIEDGHHSLLNNLVL
jgi:hypothetical protein